MSLTAWPVPRAVRRRRGGEDSWTSFLPEFRVVHPYRRKRDRRAKTTPDTDQLTFDFLDSVVPAQRTRKTPAQLRKDAFDQLRFSMPKPVARTLEPFRNNQWALLMLLRYDRTALEVAENNPALAFALAQKLRGDRETISALQCSRMRQRDLLEVLELPSSSSAVKLFRKIAPSSINGDNWAAILHVIRKELTASKSPLFHLPHINSGVVEILGNEATSRAATTQLLTEVSEDRAENHRGRVVHLISSTLQMQDELHNRDRISSFTSIGRLKEVHSEITARYRRRIRQLLDANGHNTSLFQNPPLPGIPGCIEPITSPEGLVNEGEAQGNCVASYATRVQSGTTFIYRVLRPQRATLSIVRASPFADWCIGELEGPYNTDVEPGTELFVECWLERNRNLVE